MTRETPGQSVKTAYDLAVTAQKLSRDAAQVSLAVRLDQLNAQLAAPAVRKNGSFFARLIGPKTSPLPARGLYIHGAVGRGKTMLMDMFFAACPDSSKRRVHFHAFMQDVHERIHAHRQAFKRGENKEEDPIAPVARDLAKEARLLCFDEFHVLDIADAMILSRLFKVLFEEGVVLVATSNLVPGDLYFNGLNRELFLPFIALLKQNADVFNLDAKMDYRREKLKSMAVYGTPLNAAADAAMDEAWALATAHEEPEPKTIMVRGHRFDIPLSAPSAARFGFDDLCAKPLGAADYLALAKLYPTIFIDHVPHLDFSRRNEAKRFIILIDVLYDFGSRIFISASDAPDDIYSVKSGLKVGEFTRTSSRLIEMASEAYVAAWEKLQKDPSPVADSRQFD
jgi:cell division protein ZapE